ncbi:hypothetical protein [Streptomyces sp. NPDC056672]|uniref:hypothetical protein n=1 Tax=Streptomyces sp. NPDC056672 TaxID=3345906 RepID=UPI00369E8F37
MALQRHEIWVDFGLSGLTRWFHRLGSTGTAMEIVVGAADWGEGSFAPALLEDALRLLESPLSTRTLDILWCAATEREYTPDRWIDGRQWLRQIAEACVERIRKDDPSFVPEPLGPAPYEGRKDTVLAEIRAVGPALDQATAEHPYQSVPDVVAALEQAVTQADPDLGFRLFLRAMKAYRVPISESRYDLYHAIGESFGYSEFVVDDGDLVVTPSPDRSP